METAQINKKKLTTRLFFFNNCNMHGYKYIRETYIN